MKEKMNYDEFCKRFMEDLKLALPDNFEVREETAYKSGLGETEAIAAGPASPDSRYQVQPVIYPRFYFNAYIEDEKSFPVLVIEATRTLQEALEHAPTQIHIEPEYLFIKAVNAEKEKGLLDACPHKIIADLAFVPYIKIDGDDEVKGSAVVKNELLGQLHMTGDEVIETAIDNTFAQLHINDIASVMMSIMADCGMDEEYCRDLAINVSPDETMYVCKGGSLFGAGILASSDALKEAGELLGENFYILPSSKHEVLLVRESAGVTAEELKGMVEAVNAQEVSAEDFLSDNVYYYDTRLCVLSMVGEEKEKRMERELTRGKAI